MANAATQARAFRLPAETRNRASIPIIRQRNMQDFNATCAMSYAVTFVHLRMPQISTWDQFIHA
jgi:hypothetical protein